MCSNAQPAISPFKKRCPCFILVTRNMLSPFSKRESGGGGGGHQDYRRSTDNYLMLTFQPLMRLDPRRKCLIEVKVRSEIFYHVALYLSTPRITPPPHTLNKISGHIMLWDQCLHLYRLFGNCLRCNCRNFKQLRPLRSRQFCK